MFECPFCPTVMVRNKDDRSLLECPHCAAKGTSNVLHSQWSKALAVQRMEQLAKELETNDAPITRAQVAGLIMRTLYRGETRP